MKKSVFSGKSGLVISILSVIIVIGAWFMLVRTRNWIWTLFLFIHGLLCLYDYFKVKNKHCLVTGIGFIFVGIVALLNTLFIINILWRNIWFFVLIIIIISFVIEYFSKRG